MDIWVRAVKRLEKMTNVAKYNYEQAVKNGRPEVNECREKWEDFEYLLGYAKEIPAYRSDYEQGRI